MSDLKRVPVKYIRDYIKKKYKIRDSCYICGTTEKLELHHIYSISELYHIWCGLKSINPDDVVTVKEITSLRVIFEEDNSDKLSNENLYTLCKQHHERLHNLYGQRYPNYLAPKVLNWLKIQKEKQGSN